MEPVGQVVALYLDKWPSQFGDVVEASPEPAARGKYPRRRLAGACIHGFAMELAAAALLLTSLSHSDAVQRSRVIASRPRALPLWVVDVMPRIRQLIAMAFALIPLVLVFAPSAARAEKRIALVIGNAGYQVGALATPANDAG